MIRGDDDAKLELAFKILSPLRSARKQQKMNQGALNDSSNGKRIDVIGACSRFGRVVTASPKAKAPIRHLPRSDMADEDELIAMPCGSQQVTRNEGWLISAFLYQISNIHVPIRSCDIPIEDRGRVDPLRIPDSRCFFGVYSKTAGWRQWRAHR